MTLREFAQAYTDRQGWSVIPCLPKSKRAAIGWKTYQERLPDEQELNEFFGDNDRNLAIITGDVSNRLLVVDFDVIDLFVDWWKYLYRRSTLAVTTGKGVHLYFKLLDEEPAVHCGKFLVNGKHAGEIRYNGGYVLAPPSIHPNGIQYKWIDAPLLNVKFDELKLERLKQSVTIVQQRPGRPAKPQPAGHIKNPKSYAESALKREAEKIETSQEGIRNTQLYESAVKLAKYADILGTDWIRTRLIAAAHSVGLGMMEASKTVNSGLNKALIKSV
jgi:hypothetical protein